jgi:hypothetical protein
MNIDDLIIGREFYPQRLEKPVLYLDERYGLVRIDGVIDTEDGGLFLSAWKVESAGENLLEHNGTG